VAVRWVVWLEDVDQVEGLHEAQEFDLEGLGAQILIAMSAKVPAFLS
jgi:hypothetical protein